MCRNQLPNLTYLRELEEARKSQDILAEIRSILKMPKLTDKEKLKLIYNLLVN